jgi:hypothetical protein
MEFVVRTRLGAFSPNADVVVDEEEGRVVAVIEIAGADPQALRIEFDGRNLTIAGRRCESIVFCTGSSRRRRSRTASSSSAPAPGRTGGHHGKLCRWISDRRRAHCRYRVFDDRSHRNARYRKKDSTVGNARQTATNSSR